MTVGGRLGEFGALEIEEASLRLALGWSSGTQSNPSVNISQFISQPVSRTDDKRAALWFVMPFTQSLSLLYSPSAD